MSTHRAVLYTRISQDREGQALGVQRQEKLCRALAAELGWSVVAVFSDNDTSASKKIKRPGYDRAMGLVSSGDADAVIAYSLKRLVRRWDQGVGLLELAQRHAVAFAFVRGAPVDLNSASGRDQFRGMITKAIYESEETGERVADTAAQRAELGRVHGGPRAFGYERNGVAPRPAELELVAEAAADLLAGSSLYSIAQQWNARGVGRPSADRWHPPLKWPSWTGDLVARTLVQPRYAGIRVHKGQPYGPAPWPAAFDEITHRRLVERLSSPDPDGREPGERFRSLALVGSGVFLCGECGEFLRSGGHNRSGKWRYRCYGCGLTRQASDVDDYVTEEVARLLDTMPASDHTAQAAELARLMAEEAELQQQADAYEARKAEMPPAIFRRGQAEFRAELRRVRQMGETLLARRAQELSAQLSRDNFLRWELEKRRTVIGTHFVVTVRRAARGRGAFNPSTVTVERRQS